jgi:PncC family amidohydrolase
MTVSEGEDGSAPHVASLLLAREWSVALAESCTGGLIMKRLTDTPGSSRYLAGGVVAYADRIKVSLLGVDPALLLHQGAVSREVARAMALGVAERLGVEVGLSITGIAGPGGAVPGKPVGTVWFGCAIHGRTIEERVQFSGEREEIR